MDRSSNVLSQHDSSVAAARHTTQRRSRNGSDDVMHEWFGNPATHHLSSASGSHPLRKSATLKSEKHGADMRQWKHEHKIYARRPPTQLWVGWWMVYSDPWTGPGGAWSGAEPGRSAVCHGHDEHGWREGRADTTDSRRD